ncbi:MAG TPA: pantoate--beta-alanine ligase [Acidimicrobiales bacterium]|nr:pantoate--beta-alanine ligase [Acidimicrobiales bacterium]
MREPLRRGDDAANAANGVDLLVIATPDAAIAEVAAQVAPSDTTVVAHLSGSLGLDVLAPHPRRASIHPLLPLPDPERGAARLLGAHFAVAGDPMATTVVAALDGIPVEVADEHRAAYHAAATVAANHLVALLGQVERIAAAANVPLDAYLPLVQATIDDVKAKGPAAALTGPVARGDHETVARHLAAIPAEERPAYEALAGRAARLVHRQGITVVDTVEAFRKALDAERAAGRTVGLVPTMGYLHDGHAGLMRRAAAECDVAAATVFVNPLQFAPTEDLAAYPRDLDRDIAIAEKAGVTVLFAPSVEEMYPGEVFTTVHVAEASEGLEGASRPTHFDGVATVVAKLFNIAGPCRAYFGEKDWQQLAVVRQLAADLSIPVEVVGCPIAREPDGLAMSSRNVYLNPEERRAATVLHRALLAGRHGGPEAMRTTVATEPLVELDYAEQVGDRLLIAARVGRTRLIDNMGVR